MNKNFKLNEQTSRTRGHLTRLGCSLLSPKIVLLVLFLFPSVASAQQVDMSIIAEIESSNNPRAWNKGEDARGLCQIRQCDLTEYNQRKHTNYIMKDLFTPSINMEIADWYMNKRIPQMLEYYNIPDTIENRIWAYNAGIGNVVKNRMPQTTRDYIRKYKQRS